MKHDPAMTDQSTYCTTCGTQEITEETQWFDEKTGKPLTHKVCPNACKHGYHDIRFKKEVGFFRRTFFNEASHACIRCGLMERFDAS